MISIDWKEPDKKKPAHPERYVLEDVQKRSGIRRKTAADPYPVQWVNKNR